MNWSIIRTQVLVAGLFFALPVTAQQTLETYLKRGLDSNLALRQQSFDLEKARLDLRRAQSQFYPQANIASQYTLAHGGRTQDIPIGDLLNNVYSTLNELTSSGKFPQVQNQNITFLPNDFHDTKLEVTMPVVNMNIRYNKQIKEEQIKTRQAGVEVYKRELVKTIKQAYYQYLQADRSVAIYNNALSLVQENLRVSEKMVANGTATKEATLRAKAQVSQVQASAIEAANNRQNAAAYFNFLLNQPLETPVGTDSSIAEQFTNQLTVSTEVPAAREELAQLKSTQRVLNTSLKMNKSYLIPNLNAFYNIGFQGFGFRFNSDQFYQLGGLQLQWSLFRANDNKYKIQQSQLDLDAVANQYREVEQQLTLQVRTAYNNYYSAIKSMQALADEVYSAQETYRLTERRFREGQALQLELIDIRSQLTNAQIRYSLAQLAVLTRAADVERATASYKF
ncbi:TolC family protein [Paraflavitalea sp. CAU 1676]|uniref:TolC family protein n=1 Tax=Paraflavitalea sp. CAU 1676 TaxID=3032598 RepID=UPI0023DAB8A0|nr:TolC family protein [Paraflavitalea sp. CAU 1676]MDF2187491.1 TolC family protein [Paraflavitalea sp. CAU 1676]